MCLDHCFRAQSSSSTIPLFLAFLYHAFQTLTSQNVLTRLFTCRDNINNNKRLGGTCWFCILLQTIYVQSHVYICFISCVSMLWWQNMNCNITLLEWNMFKKRRRKSIFHCWVYAWKKKTKKKRDIFRLCSVWNCEPLEKTKKNTWDLMMCRCSFQKCDLKQHLLILRWPCAADEDINIPKITDVKRLLLEFSSIC